MDCQGAGLYKQFLIGEISKYLNYKEAKTCKEKEVHSRVFIQSNEKQLEKEFCVQKCPFKNKCSSTKKKEVRLIRTNRLFGSKAIC